MPRLVVAPLAFLTGHTSGPVSAQRRKVSSTNQGDDTTLRDDPKNQMQDQQGPQLGKLIEDGDRRRDAIHIAVIPVTAAVKLQPGEHVGLIEEGMNWLRPVTLISES